MSTHTMVRSWSAIGVGVFFTLVTAYVLLEDVVWYGAPLTTKHVMTAAVLAGTIYFGHAWWKELSQYHIGTTIGCTVLFLVGTATCVVMSAGRNAEVSMTKATVANQGNADRAAAQRTLKEAKTSYENAVTGKSPAVLEAKARYQSALDAETLECSTGVKNKCLARREHTTKTRNDYEAAQHDQRILVELRRKEVEVAETALRSAPAEKVANADIKAAAELLSALPYVSGDAKTIEALLLLFFPFMQALFCEVGAIVGYSIGLGHVVRQLPKAPAMQLPMLPAPAMAVSMPSSVVSVPATVVSPVSEVSPVVKQLKPKRKRPTDVQLMHEAIESLGGVAHSQNHLADYWAVSKGEVAKRVEACGDFLKVRRVGRCHEIRINDAYEYI